METDSLDEHGLCSMLDVGTTDDMSTFIIFWHFLNTVKTFLCKKEFRSIPTIKNVKWNWLCEIQDQNLGATSGHGSTTSFKAFIIVSPG